MSQTTDEYLRQCAKDFSVPLACVVARLRAAERADVVSVPYRLKDGDVVDAKGRKVTIAGNLGLVQLLNEVHELREANRSHHEREVKKHFEWLVEHYARKGFRYDTSSKETNLRNDAINLARGVKAARSKLP